MKQLSFIVFFSCCCLIATAQKGNKEVYYGNKAYRSGDLKTAAQYYENALKVAPDNDAARINLAIAQSKLKATDKSVENFDKALSDSKQNKELQAKLNYDKGTALAKGKKYEPAIDAFKKVLRTHPEDTDARDNLQKAINELKKQQNKQNKKDQNKQDQKDQKDQKNNKPKEQPKDQKQQQQQNKMSKEEAEKMLQALRNQEKETQQKLQKKAGGVPPPNGQDW